MGPLSNWTNYHYLKALLRGKYIILAFIVVSTAIAVVSTMIMPEIFVASSTIIVLEPNNRVGFSGGPSGSADTTTFVEAMVLSRTLAKQVIEETDLASDPQFLQHAGGEGVDKKDLSVDRMAGALSGSLKFVDERSGRIQIMAQSRFPELSAKMSNYVVQTLEGRFAGSEIQRVEFLESRYQHYKKELDNLMRKYEQFSEANPELIYEMQSSEKLRVLMDLERQKAMTESTVDGLRNKLRETANISDSLAIKRQIADLSATVSGMEQEINKLEEKFKGIPKMKNEYLNLERDMNIMNALYKQSLTQYEQAKLAQEVKQSKFMKIDDAVVPGGPTFPRKRLIWMIGILMGLLFGIFAVFIRELVEAAELQRKITEEIG